MSLTNPTPPEPFRSGWKLPAAPTAREVELTAALHKARAGLAIAAGWASRKHDSQGAQDKIRDGLDAIRTALRNGRPSR